MASAPFRTGDTYTREDVQRLVGLSPVRGGNWYTGYHRHNGEWFLFPTVGAAGRTGHNYHNRWEDDRLKWLGKTGSHLGQASIQDMLRDDAVVHLFTRSSDRGPFEYRGRVRAAKVEEQTSPIVIWWRVHEDRATSGSPYPEVVNAAETMTEGAVRTITINAYERDASARRRCVQHWGTHCQVCGLIFPERYGGIGDGFIHVHHLVPISSIGREYQVDPVRDLRPVCPNCHAMLHTTDPPMTIDSLRVRLSGQSEGAG